MSEAAMRKKVVQALKPLHGIAVENPCPAAARNAPAFGFRSRTIPSIDQLKKQECVY